MKAFVRKFKASMRMGRWLADNGWTTTRSKCECGSHMLRNDDGRLRCFNELRDEWTQQGSP